MLCGGEPGKAPPPPLFLSISKGTGNDYSNNSQPKRRSRKDYHRRHPAHGLAMAGQKTLLVDLDPQGHVAFALGVDKAPGLYRLVVEEEPSRMSS